MIFHFPLNISKPINSHSSNSFKSIFIDFPSKSIIGLCVTTIESDFMLKIKLMRFFATRFLTFSSVSGNNILFFEFLSSLLSYNSIRGSLSNQSALSHSHNSASSLMIHVSSIDFLMLRAVVIVLLKGDVYIVPIESESMDFPAKDACFLPNGVKSGLNPFSFAHSSE